MFLLVPLPAYAARCARPSFAGRTYAAPLTRAALRRARLAGRIIPAARPCGTRRTLRQEMAEWTGLEPATPGVTGRYSNQLNYHSACWWVLRGSNPRPSPCKGDALPAELSTPWKRRGSLREPTPHCPGAKTRRPIGPPAITEAPLHRLAQCAWTWLLIRAAL